MTLKERFNDLQERFEELEEERDDLKNDLDELRANVRDLLRYATIQDGPAFEGQDLLEKIQEVLS